MKKAAPTFFIGLLAFSLLISSVILPGVLLSHFLLFQQGMILKLLPEETIRSMTFSEKGYHSLTFHQGRKHPEFLYNGDMYDVLQVKQINKNKEYELMVVKDGWDKKIKKWVKSSTNSQQQTAIFQLILKLFSFQWIDSATYALTTLSGEKTSSPLATAQSFTKGNIKLIQSPPPEKLG